MCAERGNRKERVKFLPKRAIYCENNRDQLRAYHHNVLWGSPGDFRAASFLVYLVREDFIDKNPI